MQSTDSFHSWESIFFFLFWVLSFKSPKILKIGQYLRDVKTLRCRVHYGQVEKREKNTSALRARIQISGIINMQDCTRFWTTYIQKRRFLERRYLYVAFLLYWVHLSVFLLTKHEQRDTKSIRFDLTHERATAIYWIWTVYCSRWEQIIP